MAAASAAACTTFKSPAILPAGIDTAKAVEPAQKLHIRPFLVVRVAHRLGAGRRHELGRFKRRKKIFTRHFQAFDLEDRHILQGVGGIEVIQGNAGTVFQKENKVVAGTGELSLVRREAEHEAGFVCTVNGVGTFRKIQKNSIHMPLPAGVFLLIAAFSNKKPRTVCRPGL